MNNPQWWLLSNDAQYRECSLSPSFHCRTSLPASCMTLPQASPRLDVWPAVPPPQSKRETECESEVKGWPCPSTQCCTLLMEQKAEASANVCMAPDVAERAQPAGSVGPLMNALTFLLINMLYQTPREARRSKRKTENRSGKHNAWAYSELRTGRREGVDIPPQEQI